MASAVLFLSTEVSGAPCHAELRVPPSPTELELGDISVVSRAQLNAHFDVNSGERGRVV